MLRVSKDGQFTAFQISKSFAAEIMLNFHLKPTFFWCALYGKRAIS